MTSGSFEVQAAELRAHGEFWSQKATDAQAGYNTMRPGIGKGEDFGYLAGLNGVSDNYNKWTEDMGEALLDARGTFQYINTALNSTANDYDGTDSTVSTSFDELDPQNNVR